MPVLRRPCVIPPHFVSFARRYHPIPALCSYLLSDPSGQVATGPGSAAVRTVSRTLFYPWNSPGLPGSWGVLSYLCPAHKTPAAPYCHCQSRQYNFAPERRTTKATAIMMFSRLIHTASVPAVYASSFGFPTLARLASGRVAVPYRMGFEPIRLR